MTIEEVKQRISRHIATYNHRIEEYRESIRKSYARMQTNVDARREGIMRSEECMRALQALLDEIEENETGREKTQ